MDGIIQLEFEKKNFSPEVVKELLATIDYYRARGISLSRIYTALCERQALSINQNSQMAFNTFRNAYYQQRKKGSNLGTKLNLQKQNETASDKSREIEKSTSNDFAMSELTPESADLALVAESPV